MLQPIRKTLLVPPPLDGRNSSGVNKTGFTLIELLVVVLIIGILAAIAVPQYKLAVDKTRLKTYMPIVRSLADAQELFYVANGRYASRDEREALELSFPSDCTADSSYNNLLNCGNHVSFGIYSDSLAIFYCMNDSSPCRHNNYDVALLKRYENQPAGGQFEDTAGKWGCSYQNYNTYEEKLCKALMKGIN